ncbi:hypothetical protein AGABI1DRAFT_31694 [Agaricus bisporus var. burnettii JB137-S8]|uniref:B30.2/SPRY domain-containing protein n=1 Tax=Agaricus bisporus var. burnettii (strain JB137-S8 / ATCC MYA-4627 / FGSC 10392) TaxID=597362 RepID=K5Y699_AGABU|nr:uncharacterized protein AGABI1DRAFT_31694 [Agaricus bisporus var. burnettii JB137-S8]EKM83665.1 hypothetical protein AGABI1DRAFT_31694 [Agaricus bisporus var. burnettii JB137-S8]
MSLSNDSDEDSSPSPPPPSRDARPMPTVSATSEEQVTYPLPTRWGDQNRLNVLSVSHDGRELSHHGNTANEKEHAANARANHFVPPACGIYYFEVEIRSKEQKRCANISPINHFKYSRLPGWEASSWGYHGDDGNAYEAGRPGGVTYAPTFGSGDIIGCGIDFTNHKVFYTKNQTFLGFVFDDVGKEGNIYPVVGLRHSGDCVRVNFGHDAFAFDIENHVQERRKTTWDTIMKTPLNSTLLRRRYHKNAIKSLITITEPPSILTEDESKSVLSQLVLSYLVHHGYAKAARAFHKQQNRGHGKLPEDDVEMDGVRVGDDFEGDIERRTAIVNSIMKGDIDTTLEEIRRYYPTVLEADDGLVLFKLRCRKLVELILETNEIKRGINNGKEREESSTGVSGSNIDRQLLDDDGMNMDVDDDALDFAPSIQPLHQSKSPSLRSPSVEGRSTSRPATTAEFEAALTAAIEYGQNFNNDYKLEKRPELRQMFEQASSVIAWNNPFEAGGGAADVAGQEARVVLANEVNEAILKSQGQPVRPTLEMVYRHAATCLTQLGLAGVGSAVFADVPKELLEP